MQIIDNIYGYFWNSMTANNCNTYLIDGPTRILIDPGHLEHFGHVQGGLEKIGFDKKDIGLVLCTHAHPDHMEGIQLFDSTSALFTLHEREWEMVKTMLNHFGTAFQIRLEDIRPNFFLKEGDLSVNGLDFKIIHSPGHSPGSVCIYWPEKKVLFTGDLIFKEGLGRTDLPGGNGTQLKESIKSLADLDIEWILPGHGDMISGAQEVRRNFNDIEKFWFAYV